MRIAAERFLEERDAAARSRGGGPLRSRLGFHADVDRTLALDQVVSASGRRDRGIRLERAGAPDSVGAGDFDTASPGSLGRGSFAVLEAVVDKLRPIPARRKAIVWFSRGGEMPANFETNLEIGQPIGRNEEALRSLIDRARAANVAIYTVDPRGLVAPDSAGRDNPGAGDFADTGTHRDLAAATGGRAFINANDIDGSLQKMAVENRAYYLLGYEPAPGDGSKKPKARKIRVATRAPGVELLHRSIYLPGVIGTNAVPELIASPLPVRDLPIALAPAAVAIDKKKRGLLLPFEIGRDLRDDTEVEYSAIALDPEGKVVSRANGRGRAKDGRVVGDLGLAAESKTYQVRFAARAVNPEISGLALATVRVPEGKSKEAECAGICVRTAWPARRAACSSRASSRSRSPRWSPPRSSTARSRSGSARPAACRSGCGR